MGIIKSKFKKMEEFDVSMDELNGSVDPRSPNAFISRTPLNEFRTKTNLITKTVNLANISTPIHNDLMLIQDKRFKHLAQSFVDPRSPSDGIVRSPIVLKSTDISSIVNTPRILEEELEDEEDEFQKTFEEALSKMSFDDCLSEGQRTPQLKPNLIETHFDCISQEVEALQPIQPLKPLAISNLAKQSAFDPRSPTIGIDRTPLAFEKPERLAIPAIVPIELNLLGDEDLVDVEKEEEQSSATKETEEEEGETKDIIRENKKKEEEEEKDQQQKSVEEKSEIFIDVGQVIFGTPVNVTTTNQPIQQVRTPLSCLGNRRRVDLNSQSVTKSPLTQKSLKPIPIKESFNSEPGKAKKKSTNTSTTTNPFETAPRKLIR